MANNLSVDGNIIVGGTQTITGATTFAGSVTLGDAPTDTVGFYGLAVTQQAVVAAVVTTGVATTAFGFASTTQGNALVAAVNSILTVLKNYGMMATA